MQENATASTASMPKLFQTIHPNLITLFQKRLYYPEKLNTVFFSLADKVSIIPGMGSGKKTFHINPLLNGNYNKHGKRQGN